jgi:hypothetical protein
MHNVDYATYIIIMRRQYLLCVANRKRSLKEMCQIKNYRIMQPQKTAPRISLSSIWVPTLYEMGYA